MTAAMRSARRKLRVVTFEGQMVALLLFLCLMVLGLMPVASQADCPCPPDGGIAHAAL